MNKRAKGNRIEREFIQYLESKGHVCWKPAHCKYSGDIFGLFDVASIKDRKLFLWQVKSNRSDFYKAKSQINEFRKSHYPKAYVALRLRKGVWKLG